VSSLTPSTHGWHLYPGRATPCSTRTTRLLICSQRGCLFTKRNPENAQSIH
jgi:hypothetical protein